MKLVLKLIFAAILVTMIVVTIDASLKQSMWECWPGLKAQPWAIATLFDAYCGFLTFFVWVAFKEGTMLRSVVWFVLIMTLGNIAMSIYVLIQLFQLKPEEPVQAMLWSRAR
jgi:hypothetical protein